MKRYIFLTLQMLCVQFAFSQAELLKYGDFESWITRDIKESALMGITKRTFLKHIENAKASGYALQHKASKNTYAVKNESDSGS